MIVTNKQFTVRYDAPTTGVRADMKIATSTIQIGLTQELDAGRRFRIEMDFETARRFAQEILSLTDPEV